MKRLLLAVIVLALCACGHDAKRITAPEESDWLYNIWVHLDAPGFYTDWYLQLDWFRDGKRVWQHEIKPLPDGLVSTTFSAPVGPAEREYPYDFTVGRVYTRNGVLLWTGRVEWEWNMYLLAGEILVPFNSALTASETGYRKEN